MPEEGLSKVFSQSSCYITKSKVCVNSKNESIGDGVFAAREFGAGEEVVAIKRPLAGSLDSERLYDTCANCYVWTEGSSAGTRLYVPTGTKVQRCGGCQRFRYCSKICQKEAWMRGHKHECKALSPMADRVIPKAILACTELLSRRKNRLITDENWELLCRLQSHIDDFKQTGQYENIELMAMGVSQFSLTQNMFNKDFVAAMYARVLTNSLTLITPTLDPLGIVLDSVLGHINHSCDPNAYIMMDGPETSVRTLRPINKDEEIFISYIDTTNPYHRRQSELRSRWFFHCWCEKCEKGATLDEDRWAIAPEALPEKTKLAADTILEHESFEQDPANYVGDSKDEMRVAALQGKVFEEYEKVQRTGEAKEAVQAIQDAMQLCHQSSLWPIHRQPYAALRDELIVNLLSIDDFRTAWAHCAKRYKYILPKLYPVPFHPVRVVQTWQMAMLAAYIASTDEGLGTPGVNMGLIAMMLVKQVLDASSLSHGTESAFTKSVRSKAEEMIAELKRSVGDPGKEVMDKELEAQKDMLVEMGEWASI